MPRPCTVCTHPHRDAIDQWLVEGGTATKLAALFQVSADALDRHQARHLPNALVQAHAASRVARADDLLDRLLVLANATLSILQQTSSGPARDNDVALKAIARAEKQIELQARLVGELRATTTVNILLAPQWIELRTLIVQTLEPFEAAREAVLGAIQGAEAEGVST